MLSEEIIAEIHLKENWIAIWEMSGDLNKLNLFSFLGQQNYMILLTCQSQSQSIS